jgi:uncharacterized protein
MNGASLLWRRLDTPGHDACVVQRVSDGWLLEGKAVFLHSGEAAQLAYHVRSDAQFHARGGRVSGFLGERPIDLVAERTGSGWLLDGVFSGLAECLDLDFGFTPATNWFQLRRLALSVGMSGAAPAAWLDLDSLALEHLDQTYERRSATSYWYDAPRFDYHALLEVNEMGFVHRYPELWEAEDAVQR